MIITRTQYRKSHKHNSGMKIWTFVEYRLLGIKVYTARKLDKADYLRPTD
jgi:hypothetical protein